MLARAHMSGLGPRRVTHAVVSLDKHAANTAAAQLNGGRESRGTSADNQNCSIDRSHPVPPTITSLFAYCGWEADPERRCVSMRATKAFNLRKARHQWRGQAQAVSW